MTFDRKVLERRTLLTQRGVKLPLSWTGAGVPTCQVRIIDMICFSKKKEANGRAIFVEGNTVVARTVSKEKAAKGLRRSFDQ